jgi:hypothetical protein
VRATHGSDFTSYNDESVTGVTMRTATLPATGNGFTYTFPAHSVTMFQLA